MQNQIISKKANTFRKERIQTISLKENFPNLNIDSSILIHIVPYSFLNYQVVDFSMLENSFKQNMKPILSNGYDYMYNIDGFATFATSNDRQMITSYNQIFRNGVYEVYSTDMFYETRHNNQFGFDGESLIDEMLKSIKGGLHILNEMKIEPPFLISFSFHNVLGKLMDNSRMYTKSFKQNEIVFPLISVSTYETDIKSVLKPNFDILWQSFGFPKCTVIDVVK